MTTTPLLYLTDGTTLINLLGRDFRVSGWQPSALALKGGGSWSGSPLAHGRQLEMYRYENQLEMITIVLEQDTEDEFAAGFSALFKLLQQANDYWQAAWATSFVYIGARGENETNTRYAVVRGANIPTQPQDFQPVAGNKFENTDTQIIISLEHGPWQSTVPGTGDAVAASSEMTYLAQTYGREATTLREVYVANKHATANITHVFQWTSPGGPFSGNLIGMATPFDIFPGGMAGPANGDAVYFGIETAVSGLLVAPFTSLVFDVATPGATYGAGDWVTWQYWNGGAWQGLNVFRWDGTTSPLGSSGNATLSWQLPGVNAMNWPIETNWAATVINGVTAYWIRCVVTEATGIGQVQQQNRNIYAVMQPYLEVDADQVEGDLPAIARHVIEGESDSPDWPASSTLRPNFDRVTLALRSTSRGLDFTPYLNFSDRQCPCYTLTLVAATATLVNDNFAATGRCVRYQPVAPQARQTVFQVGLYKGATNYSSQYEGEFHAYLRYYAVTGADGDLLARLRFGKIDWRYPGTHITDTIPLKGNVGPTYKFQVADFGIVRFPVSLATLGTLTNYAVLMLDVQTTGTAGAKDYYFYDIVLMPADESLSDFSQALETGMMYSFLGGHTQPLDINSFAWPKDGYNAELLQGVEPIRRYTYSSAAPTPWLPNKRQRLWFMFWKSHNGITLPYYSYNHITARYRGEKTQIYAYKRGAK